MPKLILFWNDDTNFTRPRSANINPRMRGIDLFERLNCEEKDCIMTYDRNLAKDSDVIIFHIPSLDMDQEPPPKPKRQRWVFLTHESPCHTPMPNKKWLGMFNWTATYRLDSDFWFDYGRLAKRKSPLRKNYREVLNQKSGLIAWMVSNCDTVAKRLNYVRELKKYVPVDVYGKCGKLKCSKQTNDECWDMIGTKYKFYLSFENSLSTDYVTEKFWKLLNYDIVSISRSGANYTRLGVHKNWHIDTRNFESPKHLASFIKYLDENPRQYLQYIKWKRYYRLEGKEKGRGWPCQICKKLHAKEPPKMYTANQLKEWFYDNECWDPQDLKF